MKFICSFFQISILFNDYDDYYCYCCHRHLKRAYNVGPQPTRCKDLKSWSEGVTKVLD